jgi:hypothetical protein
MLNIRLIGMMAGAALALVACQKAPTPKATVLTLETALTAADKLALDYMGLPMCGTGASALCADPAIKGQIKAAASQAYAAVTAAQAAVDADPSASLGTTQGAITGASAAISALEAIIPAKGK